MKVLVVVNPIAGGTDHGDTILKIKSKILELGYQPEMVLTKGKDDERAVRKALTHFSPDRIIVGGGDGTIRMVAEQLLTSPIPMAILPMGSANGLATALALPQDPLEALDKGLESRTFRSLDMLRFNDKHFCIHVADIGTNALLVKKYAEGGVRGMIGYAKYLISSIKESKIMKTIIRTTEGIMQKEGIMMAFANAHKYGTGVQISEGSVSDGKFEICNVERFALDNAIKAGLTAINVFIDKNMFSDVLSCTEAEVEIDHRAHFQVDGEYIGMINHLKIEVIPSCIKLLV